MATYMDAVEGKHTDGREQGPMPAYTFCEDIVSDLHKDAYGMRPSQSWWGAWNTMTDAEKQVEWDWLCDELERSEKRAKEDSEYAIRKFEALISTTIATGAKDRAEAVRWLMEGHDYKLDGDVEHFEWLQGIPFGYIKKTGGI